MVSSRQYPQNNTPILSLKERTMRILIIGGGGREHALAWGLAHSPRQPDLFIAPGNAGTAALGRNVSIEPTDIQGLLAFARQERIDLTVVGPEQPLVEGLVDTFEAAGLLVIGPTAQAARLEGSKIFAKEFMQRHGIPTAESALIESESDLDANLSRFGYPVALKADGLSGQSPSVDGVYCAPGNAGMAAEFSCVPADVSSNSEIASLAESLAVDLTVIGPEAPLAAGIVDEFRSRQLPIVGPATDAARQSKSKARSRDPIKIGTMIHLGMRQLR